MGGRKVQRLCELLGVRRYITVGILESLWHLAGEEAPQGDIGKLSNEDIALGIDFNGDPDLLVNALCDANWLDKSCDHRLIVHDWHEHAPNWVRLRLSRERRRFINGSSARPNQHLVVADGSRRSRRRERIAAAGGEVNKHLRLRVFERDGWACKRCSAKQDLTVDHVTPVSRGGTTQEDNLQTLCRPCNSSKKDRLVNA